MNAIISSNAKESNSELIHAPRQRGESNITWLQRNLQAGSGVNVVLLGGTDQTSFRLRAAQAQIRHDFRSSHWSHVVLLEEFGNPEEVPAVDVLADTEIYEISLDPPKGFGFPAPTNGLQKGKLRSYTYRSKFPNIAVLNVPVDMDKVREALDKFQKQRAVLDAVDLLGTWLVYVWGVSRTGNPLLDGRGIPSAAMLEVVFGAVGYDLTPGLESRTSCPEAIWQAAKWWHEYYKSQDRPILKGSFHVGHDLEIVEKRK